MQRRGYDTIIVGGGPVGLATALIAARYGSVLVVLAREPSSVAALRIDCVPAALLALFVELGIHPVELGASKVHDTRLLAWEGAPPDAVRGAATVHILRPLLEERLLARVRAIPAITVEAAADLHALPPARRVLDATGRRALTAERRRSPDNQSILRGIVLRGSFSHAQQAFRLASLPTGYAYRLGTADALMIGVVQGREQWRASSDPLDTSLRLAGASWLTAGLDCGGAEGSIGGVASVQWSEGDGQAIRIGDSALARDSLASQGIANGISAALALFESADSDGAYGQRLHAERVAHLATLERLFASCMHCAHPFWRDYRLFVRRHLALEPAAVIERRLRPPLRRRFFRFAIWPRPEEARGADSKDGTR
jgi:menaquinone-9 beta-reductase